MCSVCELPPYSLARLTLCTPEPITLIMKSRFIDFVKAVSSLCGSVDPVDPISPERVGLNSSDAVFVEDRLA